MRFIWKTLLALYSSEHRELFADEMTAVFEEAWTENRTRGPARSARFALAEFGGVLRGALRQRARSYWRGWTVFGFNWSIGTSRVIGGAMTAVAQAYIYDDLGTRHHGAVPHNLFGAGFLALVGLPIVLCLTWLLNMVDAAGRQAKRQ